MREWLCSGERQRANSARWSGRTREPSMCARGLRVRPPHTKSNPLGHARDGFTRALLGVLAAFFLAACQSSPPKSVAAAAEPLVARFYLETRPDEAGVPVQLPQSGVTLNVGPKPVIVESDVVSAEVVQVELGRCLMLQLTPAAARDLYRLSVSAIGRRLVLSLNGTFLGARRIEQALPDGIILVFVEVPDAELPALAARLKQTSARVAEVVRKGRK
jgi:hypothetical protein